MWNLTIETDILRMCTNLIKGGFGVALQVEDLIHLKVI